MHRHRWIGIVATLAIVLAALATLRPAPASTALRSLAQEASPPASPVALRGPGASTPEFVTGPWRIEVIAARRAPAIPEVNLRQNAGRDWLVVITDATAWSSKGATLNPRDFAVRVSGGAKPRGFAARTTEGAAKTLGVEPRSVDTGVVIAAGKTVRVAFVFQVDSDAANPALFRAQGALPLDGPLAANPDLQALPPVEVPPALQPAAVALVADGATIKLADGATIPLADLDAPRPAECFGGQATARLTKLAGNSILLEPLPAGASARYVWAEQPDGSRLLLNAALIGDGYAALHAGTSGRFAAWLADEERSAQTKPAGLWLACTSAHGAARAQGPEQRVLQLQSGGALRPYQVPVNWAPRLVTTPDGGAWALFTAIASDGPDKDKTRLYASRFDPATGNWAAATVIPGDDVEFGVSAAVDAKGTVHVVFSERRSNAAQDVSTLVYTRADGSGGWTPPVPIAPNPNAGHQLSAALTIDGQGTLHVLWQDQRSFSPALRANTPANADIFASDLPPGGTWSPPVAVNTHLNTAVGLQPLVVVDGDRLIAVWSVYTAVLGLTSAARVDWATRPLADAKGWSKQKPLIAGRGDTFGGSYLALAADPTGGVVLAFAREANDTFLFVRRLKRGADEWGGDVLIAYGDRGRFPSIVVGQDGTVFLAYNVGKTDTIDVGAVAIPFRSIEPGPEVVLTKDDPNIQGRAVVTTDITGKPWLIYLIAQPGAAAATQIGLLRNAEVPATETAPAATPAASPVASPAATPAG